MPTTIDADTHIDETEDTWEYMRPGEEEFKPKVAYPSNPDPNLPPTRWWMIDGERQPRLRRSDEKTRTTVEAPRAPRRKGPITGYGFPGRPDSRHLPHDVLDSADGSGGDRSGNQAQLQPLAWGSLRPVRRAAPLDVPAAFDDHGRDAGGACGGPKTTARWASSRKATTKRAGPSPTPTSIRSGRKPTISKWQCASTR